MTELFMWIVGGSLAAFGGVLGIAIIQQLGTNEKLTRLVADLDKRLYFQENRAQVDPIEYTKAFAEMSASIVRLMEKINDNMNVRASQVEAIARQMQKMEASLQELRNELMVPG